jgi:Bacterial SH3 domain
MPNSQRLPASRFQIVPFACTLVLSAGLISAGSIEPFAQGLCEIMDPTGTPLNVRASPNGHIVGTLQNGVQVSVLDRAVDRKKQAWVYVGHSEDQSPIGWVYREFIACKSDGTASQGLVGSAHAVEQPFIYSCRIDGPFGVFPPPKSAKMYPLRVDETKMTLEWRGKKYSLTMQPDCAKYGSHAEGNGTSFDFCTATQGYAAIEDTRQEWESRLVQAECNLKR